MNQVDVGSNIDVGTFGGSSELINFCEGLLTRAYKGEAKPGDSFETTLTGRDGKEFKARIRVMQSGEMLDGVNVGPSVTGGRVVIRVEFERNIGSDGIVERAEGQPVLEVERTSGGRSEKIWLVDGKKQKTNVLNIIGGSYGPTGKFGLYTMYSGKYSPPMNDTAYWQKHAFVTGSGMPSWGRAIGLQGDNAIMVTEGTRLAQMISDGKVRVEGSKLVPQGVSNPTEKLLKQSAKQILKQTIKWGLEQLRKRGVRITPEMEQEINTLIKQGGDDALDAFESLVNYAVRSDSRTVSIEIDFKSFLSRLRDADTAQTKPPPFSKAIAVALKIKLVEDNTQPKESDAEIGAKPDVSAKVDEIKEEETPSLWTEVEPWETEEGRARGDELMSEQYMRWGDTKGEIVQKATDIADNLIRQKMLARRFIKFLDEIWAHPEDLTPEQRQSFESYLTADKKQAFAGGKLESSVIEEKAIHMELVELLSAEQKAAAWERARLSDRELRFYERKRIELIGLYGNVRDTLSTNNIPMYDQVFVDIAGGAGDASRVVVETLSAKEGTVLDFDPRQIHYTKELNRLLGQSLIAKKFDIRSDKIPAGIWLAKHPCGDLVEHIVSQWVVEPNSPFLFVMTCCQGKAKGYRDVNGNPPYGFTKERWEELCRKSDWTNSPDPKKREEGYRAMDELDNARVKYLRSMGYDVKLVKVEGVSKGNLIIARKN